MNYPVEIVNEYIALTLITTLCMQFGINWQYFLSILLQREKKHKSYVKLPIYC